MENTGASEEVSLQPPETTSKRRDLRVEMKQGSEASKSHLDRNEDALFVLPDKNAFGLFDGVGGHTSGKDASNIANDSIKDRFSNEIHEGMSLDEARNLVGSAMIDASKKVYDAGTEEIRAGKTTEDKRMGSTGIAGFVWKGSGEERKLVFGSVGDSRVYLIREGKLEQKSIDDNEKSLAKAKTALGFSDNEIKILQDKLKNISSLDELSPKEKGFYGQFGQMIDKFLGDETLQPRVYTVDLRPGDRILVTSDGVPDNLTQDRAGDSDSIQEILSHNSDDTLAVKELIEKAKGKGKKPDDITVIVFTVPPIEVPSIVKTGPTGIEAAVVAAKGQTEAEVTTLGAFGKEKKIKLSARELIEVKATQLAKLMSTEFKQKWDKESRDGMGRLERVWQGAKTLSERAWKGTLGEMPHFVKEKRHAIKLMAATGVEGDFPYEAFSEIDRKAREAIAQERSTGLKRFFGGVKDLGAELFAKERDLHKKRIEIAGQLRREFDENPHDTNNPLHSIVWGDYQASSNLASRIGETSYKETVHTALGEKRTEVAVELTKDTEEATKVRGYVNQQVLRPILEAAFRNNGQVDEKTELEVRTKLNDYFLSNDFQAWREKLPDEVKKNLDLSLSYATNIVDVPKEVLVPQALAAKEHFQDLDNLDLDIKLTLGTARYGPNGEIPSQLWGEKRTALNEEVFKKLREAQQKKGVQFSQFRYDDSVYGIKRAMLTAYSQEVGIYSTAIAPWLATKLGVSALRSTAVPLGAVGIGAIQGVKEYRNLRSERGQLDIEEALGYERTKNAVRSAEMAKYTYHKVEMGARVSEIEALTQKDVLTKDEAVLLLAYIADADARVSIGQERNINLFKVGGTELTAPFSKKYQQEEMNLDLARAKAKVKLREALSNNSLKQEVTNTAGFAVDTETDKIIKQLTEVQRTHLKEGAEIDDKFKAALGVVTIEQAQAVDARDKAFQKFRTWQSVKKGAVATGASLAFTEVVGAGRSVADVIGGKEWEWHGAVSGAIEHITRPTEETINLAVPENPSFQIGGQTISAPGQLEWEGTGETRDLVLKFETPEGTPLPPVIVADDVEFVNGAPTDMNGLLREIDQNDLLKVDFESDTAEQVRQTIEDKLPDGVVQIKDSTGNTLKEIHSNIPEGTHLVAEPGMERTFDLVDANGEKLLDNLEFSPDGKPMITGLIRSQMTENNLQIDWEALDPIDIGEGETIGGGFDKFAGDMGPRGPWDWLENPVEEDSSIEHKIPATNFVKNIFRGYEENYLETDANGVPVNVEMVEQQGIPYRTIKILEPGHVNYNAMSTNLLFKDLPNALFADEQITELGQITDEAVKLVEVDYAGLTRDEALAKLDKIHRMAYEIGRIGRVAEKDEIEFLLDYFKGEPETIIPYETTIQLAESVPSIHLTPPEVVSEHPDVWPTYFSWRRPLEAPEKRRLEPEVTYYDEYPEGYTKLPPPPHYYEEMLEGKTPYYYEEKLEERAGLPHEKINEEDPDYEKLLYENVGLTYPFSKESISESTYQERLEPLYRELRLAFDKNLPYNELITALYEVSKRSAEFKRQNERRLQSQKNYLETLKSQRSIDNKDPKILRTLYRINGAKQGYYEELESLNSKLPAMDPNTRFTAVIPVYNEQDKIQNAIRGWVEQLQSQTGEPLDPNLLEIIIFVNKPNEQAQFDKTVDRIEELKKDPKYKDYKIHVVQKTFNFPLKDESVEINGEKVKVPKGRKMGIIYGMATDLAILRNANRETPDEVKANHIIKPGGADAYARSPYYIEQTLEVFDQNPDIEQYNSRADYPKEVFEHVPLFHLTERFREIVNLQYTNRKSALGLGVFRSALYAEAGGFNPLDEIAEEVRLNERMRKTLLKRAAAEGKGRGEVLKRDLILRAIDDPRRDLSAVWQGVPMLHSYKNFWENKAVKELTVNEVLNRHVPTKAQLTPENLKLQIEPYVRYYTDLIFKHHPDNEIRGNFQASYDIARRYSERTLYLLGFQKGDWKWGDNNVTQKVEEITISFNNLANINELLEKYKKSPGKSWKTGRKPADVTDATN